METVKDVNERYSVLCADILEPTLRKIALSFSVSKNLFYDTVHELTFPATRLMFEQAVALGVELKNEEQMGYDRTLETEKSQHRLYRIAKRLMTDQSEDILNNAQLLVAPKIYDKYIYDVMISTYGSVANLVGDTLFNKLDKSYTKRALQIEERSALSFSEFVMYTCLYMAVNRASVKVLNTPVEKVNLKRLKGRMRSIKEWLFSQELHNALFRTLTDLLAEYNEEKYTPLIEKHYREYWLPKDKRSLRNLNYAIKKHVLEFPNIMWKGKSLFRETILECEGKLVSIPTIICRVLKKGESFSENNIPDEYAAKVLHDFNVENNQARIYQDFFYQVLPIAELISKEVVPKGLQRTSQDTSGNFMVDLKPYIIDSPKMDRITKEHIKRSNSDALTVSQTIYHIAEKVCEVLDTYIDSTIVSVITLLECLPESGIAGENTLLEYFKMI